MVSGSFLWSCLLGPQREDRNWPRSIGVASRSRREAESVPISHLYSQPCLESDQSFHGRKFDFRFLPIPPCGRYFTLAASIEEEAPPMSL
jgi:hypothetical protein